LDQARATKDSDDEDGERENLIERGRNEALYFEAVQDIQRDSCVVARASTASIVYRE